MDDKLQELVSEVQQLKERVVYLEQKTGYSTYTNPKPEITIQPLITVVTTDQENPLPTASKKNSIPQQEANLMGMREEQVAGVWFNRLGIVAVLLSVSFFIKWSFDNHFIGEMGRIVIGIVFGLVFLGGGEYFQKRKFPLYGQGFTGGGIAILYFSIYAAFTFYHLISQPIAFILMILITLAASLLAVRYDAKVIGIIGVVGGFATPMLLGNGRNNHVALFTYIAILDIGVLLIAYYKRWTIFNNLTFVFTYLSFLIGRSFHYTSYTAQGFDLVSFSYLTLFFLIYLGISFIRGLRQQESFNRSDISLILLNASVYFALSYGLLIKYIPNWIGFWAVLLGAGYLLLGLFIYRRYADNPNLSRTLLTVAAGFMTVAIPMQIQGYWISMAWAVEAVVVFYLSFKVMPTKIPVAGFIILTFSLLALLVKPFIITGQETFIFLNNGAVAYLVVIFAMAFICWLYNQQMQETRSFRKRNLLAGLKFTLNLLIIYFLTQETNSYYDYKRRFAEGSEIYTLLNMQKLVLSLVWGLHGAVLIILGFWRRLQSIRLFGIALLGVVIMKVLFYDLSHLSTQNRIMSFMGLGVILLAVSWLYNRYKHQIVERDDDDDQVTH